ncbi:MAG: uroporphyrinogen-III C-methyltransferase [Candidatus Thermoplasmatota archaeon]|nr:uroporphyrinogen-III C-methyltransferase [Candidatus Thermoplasmatota archaeon]
MGKVYLIGAGPGDPDLLTVRATEILKNVNCVLYDDLVSKDIIAIIPKKIKKIKVGKIKGEDTDKQQEKINNLMVKLSKEGKSVARLKSGDPFLFGRGGEEMLILKKEHINYEIVPGITSAIGVPTSIGLPVTHRDYSSSLMILPGHMKVKNRLNWRNIAEFDGTIVFLMGAENLEIIVSNLLNAGMVPTLPVCLISNGTTRKEKILKGLLSDIVYKAKKQKMQSPLIIVIGKVVDIL